MKQERIIFITGASTGIGLAIVQLLHACPHFRVVATARAGSMHRFAKAGLTEHEALMLHPLDVTVAKEREEAVTAAQKRFGRIDVLINNAGVCHRGVVEHLDCEAETELMQVNYLAPVHMCRLVMPGMRERRSGHIINISSVGGMMAMPTMAAYSASKFALEGASEALWYELRPWDVRVVLLEPGFIHSQAYQKTSFSTPALEAQLDPHNPYFKFYYYLNQLIAKGMRMSPSTPDSIAQQIYRIMHHPDPHFRIPATFDAWVFRVLRKILPRGFYHRMLYANIPHIKDIVNDSASSSGKHPMPQDLPLQM